MKLPDKLSDLIEVALVDLDKCYRSPEYRIYFGDWYARRDDRLPSQFTNEPASGNCVVCFAGAVIAQSLGVGASGRNIFPSRFPESRRKLYALDAIRAGRVTYALYALGLPDVEELNKVFPVDDRNYKNFRRDMGLIVKALREHHL